MRADKTPILTVRALHRLRHRRNTVLGTADDFNQTIASAGIGLLINANKNVQAAVYWGHPFKDVGNPKTSLQDYGWHLSLSISAF